MSNKFIRAAIEGRLQTWAKAQVPPIPVVFENRGAVPVTGALHLRGYLLPADTLNPSQGGQHKRYGGVYQISIFEPENEGTGDSDDLAKAIEVLFACPTTIPKQGVNVQILQTPSVARSRPDGAGFWVTPISITYTANDFS